MWRVEVYIPEWGWRPAPGLEPQRTRTAAHLVAINAFGGEWWAQYLRRKQTLRVVFVPEERPL